MAFDCLGSDDLATACANGFLARRAPFPIRRQNQLFYRLHVQRRIELRVRVACAIVGEISIVPGECPRQSCQGVSLAAAN